MPTLCSIFDLDHTLISANSSFRFGTFLYQRKFFGFPKMLYLVGVYALHKAGVISIQGVHSSVFKILFKGCLASDFKSLVDDFLDQHLKSMLYMPAWDRLKEAQQYSQKVVILSSSPDFIVRAFADRLGVCEWGATTYNLDESGRFRFISNFMLGEDKARYVERLIIEQGISADKITAFSDSHHDMPFLKAAGRAVVVNPNRFMRNIARENSWEIL